MPSRTVILENRLCTAIKCFDLHNCFTLKRSIQDNLKKKSKGVDVTFKNTNSH